MRPRPRRSSNAARPSSASGGCAIALSPTASRKPATACSPSHGCRQVSGEAREQRTRSSVCTKSSSGGSRRRPCCRRQKRQRCCSGRCSPLVRSTCARLMVGRPSPQSSSISRLTSPPDQILSKCRRSRHQIPTPLATAPYWDHCKGRRKGREVSAKTKRASPSRCSRSGAVSDEWQPSASGRAIRVGSFWERAVTLIQHSHDFLPEPHGGADFMVRCRCFSDSGLCQDHHQLEIGSEDYERSLLASNDVRTLKANQLGVDVKRVTDEAHFTDDLGAD